MQNKEREITDRKAIDDIIRRSRVCRLGLSDGDRPYIIPLCFGYRNGRLYFHTADRGLKIDILKKNPRICFEFDIDAEVIDGGEKACKFSMRYRSVIGFGRAFFIEDLPTKIEALDAIMEIYSEGEFEYPEKSVEKTTFIGIEIESMTGKMSGYSAD